MQLRFLLAFLFTLLLSGLVSASAQETAPPDYRFHFEVLAEGLPQPMTMEEAPDGRLFFIEIAGKVKVFDPKTRLVSEIGEFTVTTAQENGLLGMALDPDFATNSWIYFMHSPPDYDGQYVSRLTLVDGKLDPATRVDLLHWHEQREQCCHHAGAMRFGPDGYLYLSTGDNTNPFNESEGYAPIDERPDRGPWDAQKSSANTNDLRGKILRIKPTPEGGYTIPEGNLFPPGTPKTRPEIYAMGFRNPWRFNIDRKTGWVYVGDVGPDAGSNKEERGPQGYDTVNQLRGPGNYGWPHVRGNRAYIHFDYEAKTPGAAYDPTGPANKSPYNTGLEKLPPVEAPLIYYPPGPSEKFPILGRGGRTACGGPVFHYDPAFEKTGGLPEYYDGMLLFYDWQRPFVHWARLDAEGKLVEILPFTAAARVAQGDDDGSGRFQIKRPVDFMVGRDGALYFLDYGETWGANADSRLVRMSYQRGNLAPVTKATVSPTSGAGPLEISLSAAGSYDHEGDPVTYEWRLGETVLASGPEATVTLSEPGDFRIELVVSDDKGGVGRAAVPVTVGNTVPVVRFVSPQNGDFFTPGEPVRYRLEIEDAEDGASTGREAEFSVRTLVSSAWASADGKLSDLDPGLTRMKQSDCFNCHTVDQKLVGPTLMEIAKKYAGQPGAIELSVERIIKGSTGVWGPLPMLPHANLTADEVHMMVKWIFSLGDGKTTPTVARGIEGQIVPPKDDKLATGLVEATFTDLGKAPAGPLSGKAVVRIRTRRLEAEKADQIEGAKIQGNVIGSIAHGHFIRYNDVPLSEVGSIKVRASAGASGGAVEIRSGAVDGELLGSVSVPPTGGWHHYAEFAGKLGAASAARGDLYLVFVNPGKGGLMNIDWVEFGK